ncbi:MAG TPA: hypothetical protein VJB08_07065 [Candidatus Nanoarchaeia archaeon]|nr:hypothetical protein [Candidatus Nanoarchaeia archaeon]
MALKSLIGRIFVFALVILVIVLLALLTKNQGDWLKMWSDFMQLVTTGTVS